MGEQDRRKAALSRAFLGAARRPSPAVSRIAETRDRVFDSPFPFVCDGRHGVFTRALLTSDRTLILPLGANLARVPHRSRVSFLRAKKGPNVFTGD